MRDTADIIYSQFQPSSIKFYTTTANITKTDVSFNPTTTFTVDIGATPVEKLFIGQNFCQFNAGTTVNMQVNGADKLRIDASNIRSTITNQFTVDVGATRRVFVDPTVVRLNAGTDLDLQIGGTNRIAIDTNTLVLNSGTDLDLQIGGTNKIAVDQNTILIDSGATGNVTIRSSARRVYTDSDEVILNVPIGDVQSIRLTMSDIPMIICNTNGVWIRTTGPGVAANPPLKKFV